MIGYLIRRVIQAVIVVIGVCAITFILYHLFPGGPIGEARIILGPRATPAQLGLFINQNGLNKPIWTQFIVLVGHVFTFNLGYSYKLNEPVATIILQKLPKTLVLLGLATLVTVIVAIPLGIFQVLRRNKPSDYALTTLSFIFYATPTFFLGIVLIELFAIHWHIFPPEAPQSSSVGSILADWQALVLPVFTLAAVYVAGFSRYMRSSMMEALTEDYVRTARAKGMSSATRQLRPRPAQRAHPDHHPARAHASGDRERRPHHRGRLQLPGHGARLLQRRHQQRLPAPHRHRSSSRPWRPSSAHCSPTSSTPSSTRGSAMCDDPHGATPGRGRRARTGDPASRATCPSISEAEGALGGTDRTRAGGHRGRRGGWRRGPRQDHLAGLRREQACRRQRRHDRSSCCCSASSVRTSTSPNQANLVVTNVNQVLAHPGAAVPARHRPERLRHRRAAHGRRRDGARDRVARGRHRHGLRRVLRGGLGLRRRRRGRRS